MEAEKHFGIYATFISFFPQLVAGPIERTGNLLPQIKAEHHFDSAKAIEGCKLMLWGFFKKLVIADNVAKYVDLVYASPNSYTGFDLALVILFFTFQIYCDFSGYSDIAVGTAKLLDIDLMTNFRSPYFSSSIKEFWSRWHISLSTWFKDYLYIPLGGNRCSERRHYFNLIITFLISGLWHGANWTFIFWGGVHGLAQILENIFQKPIRLVHNNRAGKVLSSLIVFCFCNFAWVLFRAGTLSEALYIISHVFDGITHPASFFHTNLGIGNSELAFIMLMILVLAVYDLLNYKGSIIKKIASTNVIIQWSIYILMGLCVIIFSQKGVAAEFVYFQF